MTELGGPIRGIFDRVRAVTMDEVQAAARRRRRRRRNRALTAAAGSLAAVVAVLVALLAFVPSGSPTKVIVRPAGNTPAPTSTSVPGGLSATLSLPETEIPAGGSFPAVITMDNTTGSPEVVDGCGGLFEIELEGNGYQAPQRGLTCLQRETIPPGKSRYTVTVSASYYSCTSNGSGASSEAPACIGNDELPPLPPGLYQATVFFQSASHVALPKPIPVRVLAAPPACRAADVSVYVAKKNPSNANQSSDYIGIRNTGRSDCLLRGYPRVAVTGSGTSDVQILHQSAYEISDPGAVSIALQPGSSAYFGVGWSTEGPTCAAIDRLGVTLPGGGSPVSVPASLKACAGTDGRPFLDVTSVAPAGAFSGAPAP